MRGWQEPAFDIWNHVGNESSGFALQLKSHLRSACLEVRGQSTAHEHSEKVSGGHLREARRTGLPN